MTKDYQQNLIYAIMLILGLIVVISFWIFWQTRPAKLAPIIEANHGNITPLPTPDFDFLKAKELDKKVINGNLPINTEGAGLGKKDPFAG